jgi:hypothetical protein
MIKMRLRLLHILLLLALTFFLASSVIAQEVDKGKIPTDQLAKAYTTLSWGVPIWDVDIAIQQLKKGKNILWVDTRPDSFFKKGTVRDAVLLIYNKKGMEENTLTPESLKKAMADKGIDKSKATIVFFCQGPKCHRSYNATFTAVTDWGYKPEQIVWFRAGYPFLFKEVQSNAKLKRKAKRYISDDGIKKL